MSVAMLSWIVTGTVVTALLAITWARWRQAARQVPARMLEAREVAGRKGFHFIPSYELNWVRTLADRHGFANDLSHEALLKEALCRFPDYWKGQSEITFVFHKSTDGRHDFIFNHHRPVARRKDETVLAFVSRDERRPSFRVEPRLFIHPYAARAVGAREVPIESDPAFARLFFVSATDPGAVMPLFRSQVTQLIGTEENLFIASEGGCLIVGRPHTVVPLPEIMAFYEKARHIHALLIEDHLA